MEDNVMNPSAAGAGMCGSDREIFRRVWRRVMPQDSEDCPIQLEPAAQPPLQAELLPEPSLPAERPACPAPAVLEELSPARTPAPRQAPLPPGHDVPCLGQASAVYAPLLREMIDGETETWRLYQALARRAGGGTRLLSTLAADERRHAKRLQAAHFLITGQRYQPQGQGGGRPVPDLMNGLREQFLQEQREAAAYQGAAEESSDQCLSQLFQELGQEEALHARLIRNLLEQM